MARSTVFKNNKSQVIRLPKTVAFPDGVKKVDIIKSGTARLITPADGSWDTWFDRENDSTSDREQPDQQTRDSFC